MPDPLDQRPEALRSYAASLCHQAALRRHRAVLVLSGEVDWCRQSAAAVLKELKNRDIWWLGREPASAAEPLEWSHARTRLGMETDVLGIDAFDGFDAEGFGALSGTVRAGGLLLLLIPPLQQWPAHADPQQQRQALYPYAVEQLSGHFLRRLVRVLAQSPDVSVVVQGQPVPSLAEPQGRVPVDDSGGVFATEGQRQAVAQIQRVATGHRHRPLVLSADRGRGKSAALGIAAAQRLHQGAKRIVVTAPRIDAANQVFEHAARLLPGCSHRRGAVSWQGGAVEFVPPDALLQVPHNADLLLVDEAAAIPTPILEGLLLGYGRIVFATTIHGYEGTGRGFAVRFQKVLSERTPQWQSLHLDEPVRWADSDPLEALSFAALLLDAEPVAVETVAAATPAGCIFERVEPEVLANNEQDLTELFGLLVLAHYRTSPNDLRQLLDGPQQSIYVLRYAGHVVATAVVVREGELESELANEVYLGHRRVQGHLLPQSLANHAGFPEAACLRAARVMRIAVHPGSQGRGLGTRFLQMLEQAERQAGRDYLGASFGATASLLGFWLRQGLLPVRLGLSREASSGTHSVMVLKPLSTAGETLFSALRERFAEILPELLAGPLCDLDSELGKRLLASTPPVVNETLSEQDRRDLDSFSTGLRGYELCMLAIRKLVLQAVADEQLWSVLDKAQQRLLQERVLQQHDWPQLVRDNGLSGRKQAQALLRQAVSRVWQQHCANV